MENGQKHFRERFGFRPLPASRHERLAGAAGSNPQGDSGPFGRWPLMPAPSRLLSAFDGQGPVEFDGAKAFREPER